jgi:hypothetical protein
MARQIAARVRCMRWPGLPALVALPMQRAVRRSYSFELIFRKARLTYVAVTRSTLALAFLKTRFENGGS